MSHSMSVDSCEPVFYPESDGEPMAETDLHRDEAIACVEMLRWHFRDDADVYIAGNNFFYFEEGHPKAVVSPDVYVVRGIAKGPRRIFQLWKEKRAPCFVMELSSRSTWLEDNGNKKAIYAMLGVEEYFMFDPEADCLDPPLQGYRLGEDGEYHRLEPGADGALVAETLGVTFEIDADRHLQARDTASGEGIPRPQQVYARWAAERERATEQRARLDEQQARLDEQQARIVELEAKLGSRSG